MTKVLLTILAILVLIGSVGWFISEGGWEPGIAIILSLSTLIGMNYDTLNLPKKVSMKQKGGKKSKNIQVGGNIDIRNSTKDV